MSMCGEIENTEKVVQDLESALFDLSLKSDALSKAEFSNKQKDLRHAVHRLNLLTEAVNGKGQL